MKKSSLILLLAWFCFSAMLHAKKTEQTVYEPVYHKVAEGETLFYIARRYTIDLDALMKLNRIEDIEDVRVGQRLFVGYHIVDQAPATAPTDTSTKAEAPKQSVLIYSESGYPNYHRVVPGDNLFRLAAAYETTVRALRQWNRLDAEEPIKTGQRLIIGFSEEKPEVEEAIVKNTNKPSTPVMDTLQPDANKTDYPVTVTDPPTVVHGTPEAEELQEEEEDALPVPILQDPNQPYEESQLYVLWDHWQSLPRLVRFLYYMIAFLLFSTITSYIIVMVHRTLKIRQQKKIPKLHRIYHFYFTMCIFDENEYEEFSDEYREERKKEIVASIRKDFMGNPFYRKILNDLILYMHRNMTGQIADEYKDLYLRLGLEHYSYARLNSNKWHVKVQGIRELAQMELQDAYTTIEEFINDSHPILRMEAQIALINLSRTHTLSFLNNLQFSLTLWEQMNILRLLDEMEPHQIPDFDKWLTSENESVVDFSLKMIGHFSQMEAIPAVVRVVKHINPDIREEAINTLRQLNAADITDSLKQRYVVERNKSVKLAILYFLTDLALEDDLPFLQAQLQSNDYELLMNIAKTILAIGDKGKAILQELVQTTDGHLQPIIQHVLDKRITPLYG